LPLVNPALHVAVLLLYAVVGYGVAAKLAARKMLR